MGRFATLSSEEIRLLLETSDHAGTGDRYRALVLERSSGELGRVVEALHGWSFDVDLCSDSATALELCRELAYDLVIAGYRNRGIDGVAFLSRVRELCPGACRFLISDGCHRGVLVRAVNSAGVHAILERGFTDVRILRLISKTIDIE